MKMLAEIYWLTPEEGGRTSPIPPNKDLTFWANTNEINRHIFSVGVLFDNVEPVQLGTYNKYKITFLTPIVQNYFQQHDIICICEGSKIIGRGTILKQEV